MDPLIDFHFLNKKPESCNVICSSNHSCTLGVLGASDNPTDNPVPAPILHLGDQIEMWAGSAIVLENIPETPMHINGDGVIVDLTVIRDSISFGLPTCDCCPLLIMDDKGKIALAHISTETLSLYKTTKNRINNSQKTPVLHQIFSVMKPRNCIVWVGPCIGRCCYEFGKDDADLLTEQTQIHYPGVDISKFHYPHCDDKVYVDFPEIITAAMVSMGVNAENIITEYCSCTVCGVMPKTKEPLRSYRRDGHTNDHNWLHVKLTLPESNNSIFSI